MIDRASPSRPRRIALLWDNFGPLHVDRIEAVAQHYAGRAEVIGLELFSGSDTYDWISPTDTQFRRVTLLGKCSFSRASAWRIGLAVFGACRRERCDTVFMCHYNEPGILLAALLLRLAGKRVFTMGCSKFDDMPRKAWREGLKTLFYKPYLGAIGSECRSTHYMRFLGLPADRVVGGYNTVNQARIRSMAAASGAPEPPFAERMFLCVARLVPKKNIAMLLDAYALYDARSENPRALVLAGSGPLEADLRAQAERLGIAGKVRFAGFMQTEQVSVAMRDALCLILPSSMEQFGNVVPEAQAVGCPVLLTTACGAADQLVRTTINGFIVEPDNPEGLANHMEELAGSEERWTTMREATHIHAALGDTAAFAQAVATLAG